MPFIILIAAPLLTFAAAIGAAEMAESTSKERSIESLSVNGAPTNNVYPTLNKETGEPEWVPIVKAEYAIDNVYVEDGVLYMDNIVQGETPSGQ